jgi:hypothetical protein
VTLHSVDLEDVATRASDDAPTSRPFGRTSDTHARATLLSPMGEVDPLDAVLESLRGIKCERAVEAASVCLAALARAVGCRAAMVHLWDAREETFVVVYALAPIPEAIEVLLNTRHTEMDPLLAQAIVKRSPRVFNYDGSRPIAARHAVIPGAWSVLTAPVIDGGVVLGVLELIDPLDGSCFDDRAIAAAHYVAERLADLLNDAAKEIGKVVTVGRD